MASATRTPIPVPPPTEVVLTLSEDEAQVLRDVCGRIGGDPRASRRRLIDGIHDALESVGFKHSKSGDTQGEFYFRDRVGS